MCWRTMAQFHHVMGFTCVCAQQRDDTLSAGRSLYVNYSGILQQFVQAFISKQQVFTLINMMDNIIHNYMLNIHP